MHLRCAQLVRGRGASRRATGWAQAAPRPSLWGYTRGIRTACRGRHRKASQTAGLRAQRCARSPLEEEDQGWLLPRPPSWAWRWPPSPCVSLIELYVHSDGKKPVTAVGRRGRRPGRAGERRAQRNARSGVPPRGPKSRKASLGSEVGPRRSHPGGGRRVPGPGGPSGVPTTFRFSVWALLSGLPSAGENHWAVRRRARLASLNSLVPASGSWLTLFCGYVRCPWGKLNKAWEPGAIFATSSESLVLQKYFFYSALNKNDKSKTF